MMKSLAKRIAKTLKALRQEKGWSLDKTAEETGVSKAMLGQIEREESSPTVATLWKIAKGFHTPFSSFLEETNISPKKLIHRSNSLQKHYQSNEKIRILPLFSFDRQLNCEIFDIELLPQCEHLSLPHEAGVIEHVLVISGTLEILLEGEWQTLSKGDGIRFDASQPHGYRNKSSKSAYFYNIIHYRLSNQSKILN